MLFITDSLISNYKIVSVDFYVESLMLYLCRLVRSFLLSAFVTCIQLSLIFCTKFVSIYHIG